MNILKLYLNNLFNPKLQFSFPKSAKRYTTCVVAFDIAPASSGYGGKAQLTSYKVGIVVLL